MPVLWTLIPAVANARRRLLSRCGRRAHDYDGRTLRTDIRLQDHERAVTGIRPLVDQAIGLVDSRARRPRFSPALHDSRPGPRHDVVQRRARAVVSRTVLRSGRYDASAD